MKKLLSLIILICAVNAVRAQQPYVYTIYADSVKITNDCDTAELIIENHTQNVPGFLFNKGRGRTEFRKAMKLNDSTLVFGGDTMVLRGHTLVRNGLSVVGGHVQLGGPLTETVTTISGNGDKMLVMDSLSLLDVKSDAKVERLSVNIDPASLGTAVFGAKATGNNGPFFRFYNSIGGTRFGLDLVNDEGRFDMNNKNGIANIRLQSTGTSYFNGGNVLVKTATENGHSLQVNGSTYSKYFTNITTADGHTTDGAVRLRWGGFGGSYIDFYYQENMNRRGLIASGADYRPLCIQDNVGVTFLNTPFVAIGSEWPNNGIRAKLSVQNGLHSTYDAFNVARFALPDTLRYDLIVKSSGNIIMGGDADNGNKLQVTGNSYINGGQQVTGTVRFNGLTNDNSLARIVVSDAAGNLYYRDASSLAATDLFKSDLAINGAISAPKMTITQPSAWPDYVFKPQYKLPSLNDVERFIQQNSHLPGVPSAAEIEKKGIDVGENQAVLLKKIEELTLYVIQQQKEISTQNKAMQVLTEEVAELKALIKNK